MNLLDLTLYATLSHGSIIGDDPNMQFNGVTLESNDITFSYVEGNSLPTYALTYSPTLFKHGDDISYQFGIDVGVIHNDLITTPVLSPFMSFHLDRMQLKVSHGFNTVITSVGVTL